MDYYDIPTYMRNRITGTEQEKASKISLLGGYCKRLILSLNS